MHVLSQLEKRRYRRIYKVYKTYVTPSSICNTIPDTTVDLTSAASTDWKQKLYVWIINGSSKMQTGVIGFVQQTPLEWIQENVVRF